jgi:hypothetical protein
MTVEVVNCAWCLIIYWRNLFLIINENPYWVILCVWFVGGFHSLQKELLYQAFCYVAVIFLLMVVLDMAVEIP